MRALDRKLIRDLWRLRGMILATALVIGTGIALYVMAAGALASLQATREAYYQRYRMVDVTAGLKRAPLGLLERIRAIPGVRVAEGRVTAPARITLPGFAEPVNGIAHSLPERPGGLNAVHLVRGRLPGPGELLVNEAFARAHGLKGAERLALVIHGVRQVATVVGTAQAPDHVYTVPPGNMMSDDLRFAILWLPRAGLEGPVDQVGAFNDLLLTLDRGTHRKAVIHAVDGLLAPYGGSGALAREDLVSDKFLTSEMGQLGTMARLLPAMFLAVAAFLLWVMIGRMVATERETIGLLKAFGYRGVEIGQHYALLSVAVALLGVLIGCAAGYLLGRGITGIYARFYQFPLLLFRIDPQVYATAAAIGLGAALAGVAEPVRQVIRLNAAIAIQPPVPPVYAGRIAKGLAGLPLDESTRMMLRHTLHAPLRALFSVAGIALATGLCIVSSFNLDAIDSMLDLAFNHANRQAATVTFIEPMPRAALSDLSGLPGVLAVEPFRVVPARLGHGAHSRREALIGVAADAAMVRIVDADRQAVPIPPDGLVLGRSLADRLHAGIGSVIDVEIFEGRRPTLKLRVVAIVETYQGTPAFIDMRTLDRALDEAPLVSGAYLAIDPRSAPELLQATHDRPGIAGFSLRSTVLGNFQRQIAENLGTFRFYSLAIATVLVGAVVYNNARLSFSEQVRELATMRVLGYRTSEVGQVVVGGLLLLAVAALGPGVAIGLGLAGYVADAFSSDMYSIPFAVSDRTIARAISTTLVAAIATALTVHIRVRMLDLVRVLKSRD